MTKICLIDVTPSHYREEIFSLMSQVFSVHFYFGDLMPSIKKMDVNHLKGYKATLHVSSKFGFYFYNGILRLLKRDYTHYVIDGDIRCLSTWMFLALAKLNSKKTYLWTHGWYGRESFIKKIIKKVFFKLTDGLFLYGNYAKDLLVKEGVSQDKLFVVHNSLYYSAHLDLRKNNLLSDIYKDHFSNSHPTIIFIGRLTKVKKLDMLIEALSRLLRNGENYNLVIVGDGIEHQRLKDKVMHLGLVNHVWFYGSCYDERINAELLYNADLCVAPGNIGLTAIHSLTFGCPAISHNDFRWQMPEFESIIPGKTGDFFQYNSIDSLVSIISRWFNEKKGLREVVRKDCMNEITKNWNPEFQINVFKSVFDI